MFLFLASFFTYSCHKIFFNEDEKRRELFFEDFYSVRIYGIYDIILIQDSTNRMVITGKNDINSITANITGDTLTIDDHKKMYFNTSKNKIVLHFRNLQDLKTYNPVTVSNTDTLRANYFNFDGLGEIAEARFTVDCDYFSMGNSANTLGFLYVKGKSNDCYLFNRYGGAIIADSLSCKNAIIVNESVGDVYVNASDNIKVYIWGPGNIYYYGSPVIEIAEKRGEGRLIQLNKK